MTTFSKKILVWHAQHGRKNLPWQKNKSPYRVWISEIMLQQTQVTTVIPYFEKFIQRFPNIPTLAQAPLDEVLALWSGLGYYARARNLHKTAVELAQQYKGIFPKDIETLCQLPGIGRSTAGAILAISMNQCTPILDGNVKRVLTRYHAIEGPLNNRQVESQLWKYAEAYTPQKQAGDYTQAIMDLGATLCTKSKPKCSLCPLEKNCMAYKTGDPEQYPHRITKKRIPTRKIKLIILQNDKKEILLEKRQPTGIWGGLWSLPECTEKNDVSDFCLKNFGLNVEMLETLTPFKHTFTHFHLWMTPVKVSINTLTHFLMDPAHKIWYNSHQVENLGLPAPIKQLLQKIL